MRKKPENPDTEQLEGGNFHHGAKRTRHSEKEDLLLFQQELFHTMYAANLKDLLKI